MPLRCNPAGERSERCPSGAFAIRRKRGKRVTRGKQRAEASAMPAAPTEIAECKPEKNRNHRENKKTGSVGKSTLPGVEAAGLSRFACPQPIWSRLHTVELASYRLRKDSMKFPPLAVIESFPHGLSKACAVRNPDTKIAKPGYPQGASRFCCRSGGIRTRGLLVPNQTRYQTALHLDITGADEGTRTPDLLITNRLLYQLSHIGTTSKRYYNKGPVVCPALFFTGSGHPENGVIGYTAA